MIERRRFLYGTALTLLGSCRRRSISTVDAGQALSLAPGAGGRASIPSARAGLCTSSASQAARVPPPLHPDALAHFVDRLPIPPVIKPEGMRSAPNAAEEPLPYYRIAMREAMVVVHRDLPPTRVWCYGGSLPGPTFETRSGKGLLVEWVNDLPDRHFLPIDHSLCGAAADQHEVRTVVHVHGARVSPESDGHPEDWFTPGRSALFHYPNQQEAATLWYHDHAMGVERLNQYAGLFGLFLVRDAVEEALHLPGGSYEVPLFLSDRLFDADAQLVYPTSDDPKAPWIPEFRGDAILVNGKLFPFLEVEPRLYRFRIVNASNARFYDLALSDGQPIHQIGSDQGLLAAPVALPIVTLAPGERADVLIDFGQSKNREIVLHSQTWQLLQFRVGSSRASTKAHPTVVAGIPTLAPTPSTVAPTPPTVIPTLPTVAPRLRPLVRTAASEATKTRFLTLDEYETPKTLAATMLLNGSWWRDPVTERPSFGSVEIWELVNLTEDTHPIHLHMVRFQILERQAFDADRYNTHKTVTFTGPPVPPAPQDAGWKDTVRADPGFITRIIVRFDGFRGRYVWHCHILEHAAKEMMRPFEIVG